MGTCLHSILDYAERIQEQNAGLNENILCAFKYANNRLKHVIEIERITDSTGGMTFPIQFPLTIPVKRIVWKVNWKARSKHQQKMYLQYLDGEDMVKTCGEFIEELKLNLR